MMRNSSNFDPSIHNHPTWTANIDPADIDKIGEMVPDCVADLNYDDPGNVVDLLLLLGNWGYAWGPCL